MIDYNSPKKYLAIIVFLLLALSACNNPTEFILIHPEQKKDISPIEYGWHYEEIGMIGDGGLYAEMVRNRGFEEANPPKGLEVENGRYKNIPDKGNNPRKKIYQIDSLIGWGIIPHTNFDVDLKVVTSNPLNSKNPHSMEMHISGVPGKKAPDYGIVNKGYYGMNVKRDTEYHLSFYLRGESYDGSLLVILIDEYNEPIAPPMNLSEITSDWREFSFSFKPFRESKNAKLLFEPGSKGQLWLDMVSMFPADTWDNGKSVFRSDIMQNLYDYAPDFIRFPGGCIVHGVNIETMYYWKETIGDISKRPGAWSKWSPNYRTDGLGYHEFYELCEYLNADAMYVTPSGLVCSGWVFQDGNSDNYFHPEVDVNMFIQDALDAIEYALGPVTSKWGQVRAANGHPETFPLKYIEIGNEDFGPRYYENYEKFYQVIHEKYPDLKIIANSIIGNTPDLTNKRKRIPEFHDPATVKIFDEHYYKDLQWVINNYHKFDEYKRPGPDLFIGELGIKGKHPMDILGEAIFMMNMERNGDLNPMMADRPLMRNWTFVEGKGNPLYYHTSSTSFKTSNYYMSKLFRDHKINSYYPSEFISGHEQPQVNTHNIYSSAGRNPKNNQLIIKLVNLSKNKRSPVLKLDNGALSGEARIISLSAKDDQRNTPENPVNITPHTDYKRINFPFRIELQPQSLTIIQIKEK